MLQLVTLAIAAFAIQQPSLPSILTLTVAALCVALLAGMRPRPSLAGHALPPGGSGRRTETVYLRHSDPDAPGRPRPRAPDQG